MSARRSSPVYQLLKELMELILDWFSRASCTQKGFKSASSSAIGHPRFSPRHNARPNRYRRLAETDRLYRIHILKEKKWCRPLLRFPFTNRIEISIGKKYINENMAILCQKHKAWFDSSIRREN
jgi:hypothetical protein